MKEPKTPQTKKLFSLLKDCRNTYGEHDKSSRTSIRWRKSWVNRTYRRDVKQSLTEDLNGETIADRVIRTNRRHWKKCADRPLGEMLLSNKTWAVLQQLKALDLIDPNWADKLAMYLDARNLAPVSAAFLVRNAQALLLSYLLETELNWEDTILLENFLQQQQEDRSQDR